MTSRDGAAAPASAFGVWRLVIVVAGGLGILQSTQGLGLTKLAYLAVASVAFAASVRAIWGHRDREMFRAARPWFIASGVLVALIAISLPVALAHGTPITQWLRDAATYGLFAAAPVFALDAAASMRKGLLLGLTVAFALLGALSFAISWISLRNLAVLPIDQLVLPTVSLPTVLFVVCIAAAILDQPRRIAWIVLGGTAFAVFLISGTRSTLFILVAVPVLVALAGRARLKSSAVASVGVAIVAAVLVVGVQAAFARSNVALPPPIDSGPIATTPIGSNGGGAGSPPPGISPGPEPSPGATPGTSASPSPTQRPAPNPDANLVRRIQDFLSSPERDGSFRERVTQYGLAWDIFVGSPLIGSGLGHPFTWTRLDGTSTTDLTADTPLVLPAKLGIAGLVWLTIVAIVWLRFARRLRQAGLNLPGLVMGGWAAALVGLAWTGFSVEDKGFSFAVMLILSLAFIEIEAVEVQPG
jgi:hypothetical protein